MGSIVNKYKNRIQDAAVLKCLEEIETHFSGKMTTGNIKSYDRQVSSDDVINSASTDLHVDKKNKKLFINFDGEVKSVTFQ
ncbi:hypothetical protein BH10BAC5_BH10BAC5_16930 [soil metagenome]